MQTPATLTIRPTRAGDTKLMISAALSNLTCEGAGLVSLPAENLSKLNRGQGATLNFRIERQLFSICCRVAWHRATHSAFTDIGLQLLLALSPKTTRHAYARWIVDSIVRQQDALTEAAALPSLKSTP